MKTGDRKFGNKYYHFDSNYTSTDRANARCDVLKSEGKTVRVGLDYHYYAPVCVYYKE